MEDADLHRIAQRATALMKALSHDRRLMIVCELTTGERTVGELERVVGLSQSALSQHLARLRRDGIVRTRRKAQHIYYALANGDALHIINALATLYCAAPEPRRPGPDPHRPNTHHPDAEAGPAPASAASRPSGPPPPADGQTKPAVP